MSLTDRKPSGGGITNEQLSEFFSKIYEHRGKLSPEILCSIAEYYDWDTFTAINAVCNYINSFQTVLRKNELMAVATAANEMDNLRSQLDKVNANFTRLTQESADTANKYCAEVMRNTELHKECEQLRMRLERMENQEVIERMLRTVSVSGCQWGTPEYAGSPGRGPGSSPGSSPGRGAGGAPDGYGFRGNGAGNDGGRR